MCELYMEVFQDLLLWVNSPAKRKALAELFIMRIFLSSLSDYPAYLLQPEL
jgi:hypothetical protein